jgi:hypothetical protein
MHKQGKMSIHDIIIAKRKTPSRRQSRTTGSQYRAAGSNVWISFVLLMLIPIYVQASDIKGRVSVSHYYSSDSGNYDFNMLTTKLKLYKEEDKDTRYSFNFDGRYRARFHSAGSIYTRCIIHTLTGWMSSIISKTG